MFYKITPEELTKILNELSQKPWALVNNVIVKLSSLEKVDEEPKKEPSE